MKKSKAKTSQERAGQKQEVAKWWKNFKKTKSSVHRNRLLEHYLPIVKYTAERLHAKLPEEVDVEDLMSAGIFGLMDAVLGSEPG